MPDEGTEQVVADQVGADEAAAGAPSGVAEPQVEPVADPSAPVAETVVTFDLSTPEGIKAAAEHNAALRAWREEGYGAGLEAGRQKALRDRDLEMGTVEQVQGYHAWVVSELANGKDPAELAKLTPAFVTNNAARSQINVYRAVLQAAAEFGDESAKELAETLTDDPEQANKVASATMTAYGNRREREAIANLTFDALPETHALRSYVRDQIAAGVRAELEAQAREAVIAQAPPNPPSVMGSAPSGELKPYWEMTPEERSQLSPAERDARVAASVGAR